MELIGGTQMDGDETRGGEPGSTHAKEVGARIAKLRGRRSQAAFARLTGTHVNSIGRYERGERLPEIEALRGIARATGADIEWILDGTGAAPPAVDDDGDGPELDPNSRAARRLAREAEDDGVILVPMYGARPSAGSGSALEDYIEGWHEMTAGEARELGLTRRTTGRSPCRRRRPSRSRSSRSPKVEEV